MLVREGSGASLLGIPGGGTGDLLFLLLCVLSNLPLVLGGICIYLGLGMEEVFASFSIPIVGAISKAITPPILIICCIPTICIDVGFEIHVYLTLGGDKR